MPISDHKAEDREEQLFFIFSAVGFEPDIDLLPHIFPEDIAGPVVILLAFHETQEDISKLAISLKRPDYIKNLLVIPLGLLNPVFRFLPLALIETFAMRDPQAENSSKKLRELIRQLN